MKPLFLITTLFIYLNVNAQTSFAYNPFPKTITVTGSSEIEIVPDEIYVNVELREVKKKGEPKLELEKVKQDFLQKCQTVGIADSLISIASYEGSNYSYWSWRKRKKDTELYSNISYQIKFKDSKKMDALIDILDDDVASNFQVVKVSHSKITEYRKQLKMQAIKAAKEKGIYLTEAINEKLGEAITIVEPSEDDLSDMLSGRLRASNSNMYSNNVYSKEKFETGSFGVDFKKIKLRYEVNIAFALK
jgi:uncharacterized protein YggE